MTLFSRKILSASGVVGPLAPSAMILSGKRSETPADTSDQLIGRENIQNSNLGLDPGGIVASELLLPSSWDQDVAVSLQNVPIIRFGPWEAHDGAVVLHQEPSQEQNETNQHGGGFSRKAAVCYQLVVLQLFGVDAVRVVDGSINLPHANTLGSKPVQVPHGVKTHITKALRQQRQEPLHLTLVFNCLKQKGANIFNVLV